MDRQTDRRQYDANSRSLHAVQSAKKQNDNDTSITSNRKLALRKLNGCRLNIGR